MDENQENENEVIEKQRSGNHGRKKKIFWILGIVLVLVIASGVFVSINLQKVASFVKDISAQDSKLLDRETNASSMTSKLSYNDFITEANMIIESRNKLLNQVENEKVLLFSSKIDDLKSTLENEMKMSRQSN
jgi:cytoskeletal protein RodZ